MVFDSETRDRKSVQKRALGEEIDRPPRVQTAIIRVEREEDECESEISMVAANNSEREEAEVSSPVASLNTEAAGAESPPHVASSQDTFDGRRAAWHGAKASVRPFAPEKS